MREIRTCPPYCENCIQFISFGKVYGSFGVTHTGSCKKRHLRTVDARDGCDKFFPAQELTEAHMDNLKYIKETGKAPEDIKAWMDLYYMNFIGTDGLTELGEKVIAGEYDKLKEENDQGWRESTTTA
jgi:hypothetical protein